DPLQPDRGGEAPGHYLSRHALSPVAAWHQVIAGHDECPDEVRLLADPASRKRVKPAARISVDRAGIVRAAAQVPSPNCDDRPEGTAVILLVVHGISLPPGEFGGPGIVELFTNRLDPDAHPYYAQVANLKVSSHFLIRRDGALTQFVPCAKRAWHAGTSSWRGRADCNDFSVG